MGDSRNKIDLHILVAVIAALVLAPVSPTGFYVRIKKPADGHEIACGLPSLPQLRAVQVNHAGKKSQTAAKF